MRDRLAGSKLPPETIATTRTPGSTRTLPLSSAAVAAAPEPSTLALAGSDDDMHLAIVDHESQGDHDKLPAELDDAILDVLGRAGERGLLRASLRAALRVRNQRLGEALTRLTASGQITRRGDAWVRRSIPVPATIDTPPEPERGGTDA